MSKFTLYTESAEVLKSSDVNLEIKAILADVGVRFEQWRSDFEILPEHTEEDIKKAYKTEIDRLISDEGYQTHDLISLTPDHPDKKELRQKFLSEHTHSEDEVRFFVKGSGLFTLHIQDKVYSIMCQKNDLISVPANTPHWFDMGREPEFTCLRFFNNEDGWVANYTESDIASKFVK